MTSDAINMLLLKLLQAEDLNRDTESLKFVGMFWSGELGGGSHLISVWIVSVENGCSGLLRGLLQRLEAAGLSGSRGPRLL